MGGTSGYYHLSFSSGTHIEMSLGEVVQIPRASSHTWEPYPYRTMSAVVRPTSHMCLEFQLALGPDLQLCLEAPMVKSIFPRLTCWNLGHQCGSYKGEGPIRQSSHSPMG